MGGLKPQQLKELEKQDMHYRARYPNIGIVKVCRNGMGNGW